MSSDPEVAHRIVPDVVAMMSSISMDLKSALGVTTGRCPSWDVDDGLLTARAMATLRQLAGCAGVSGFGSWRICGIRRRCA